MTRPGERAVAAPATPVGPGLVVVGDVVYRLDASLRVGESYAMGDVRGDGDDAALVHDHEVAVAPDVFVRLLAPLTPMAAPARSAGTYCLGTAPVQHLPVVTGEPPGSAPLTSWASVARAVGVSLDTLSRRRKAWGFADPRPYFVTAEDAKVWYRRGESGKLSPTPAAGAKAGARRPTPSSAGTAGTTLADLRAQGRVKPPRGGGSR